MKAEELVRREFAPNVKELREACATGEIQTLEEAVNYANRHGQRIADILGAIYLLNVEGTPCEGCSNAPNRIGNTFPCSACRRIHDEDYFNPVKTPESSDSSDS